MAAAGIQDELQHGIRIEIGSSTQVAFQITVAGKTETITVQSDAHEVDSEGVSSLIDFSRYHGIASRQPPLHGSRSAHAPYQFSDEVVSELRVASNRYGAEHGRAGGAVINAVINIVTKSGGNHPHGSAFYYLRDNALNVQPAGLNFKPTDRQHQGGFTLGSPLRKNRVLFFSGLDQHVFFVPNIVRFDNGSPVLVPQKGQEPLYDGGYEDSDKDLVFATGAHLSTLGGN